MFPIRIKLVENCIILTICYMIFSEIISSWFGQMIINKFSLFYHNHSIITSLLLIMIGMWFYDYQRKKRAYNYWNDEYCVSRVLYRHKHLISPHRHKRKDTCFNFDFRICSR